MLYDHSILLDIYSSICIRTLFLCIFPQIFHTIVSEGYQKMAESKPGLRKPVFTKVDQLRPGTSGHTLTVKVVSTKMVLQKGRADGPQVRQMRIAECLVGDETGMIIFTARNDQGVWMWLILLILKLTLYFHVLLTSNMNGNIINYYLWFCSLFYLLYWYITMTFCAYGLNFWSFRLWILQIVLHF